MKKNYLLMIAFAIMAFTAVFSSCSSDSGEDNKKNDTPTRNDLKGHIRGEYTLESKDEAYVLTGTCVVEDGGTLTIPAGTTIKASTGFGNYIIVLQGGKINVNGTAEKPVRIISAEGENAGRGKWGGLVINGKAPISGALASNNKATTEVATQYQYGGTNPNDNSGSITYLELRSTGAQANDDVEHNGLTLNGVGAGTKIENIFVIDGADDAIEFFGGCVNVTNILAVNNDDDCFDFTQGYKGKLENAYGIWESSFTSTEADPRGVEIDGNLDGKGANDKNQSDFTIKNLTIENNATNQQMDDVIKARRGAKVIVENALIKGSSIMFKNLISLKDNRGDGLETSSISLTKGLTNTLAPFNWKGNSITTKEIDFNAEKTYPDVKIGGTNAGADKTKFGWTKYFVN